VKFLLSFAQNFLLGHKAINVGRLQQLLCDALQLFPNELQEDHVKVGIIFQFM
jgi:hypothetical protein